MAPPETAGPHRRVVVVGAGFAGLVAADALATAGWDVTVLEARGRVGGRVWSERLANGGLVERGGEFITEGYDVTERLAKRLGIALDGMGIRYPDRELQPGPGPNPEVLAKAAEDAAELARADPAAPALEVTRAAIPNEAVRNVLETRLQSALAHPVDDLDARYALQLPHLTRSSETRRLRGGNQGLALELAAILGDRVRLDCPVREIRSTSAAVRVLGDDLDINVDACVVAIPVALLPELRFDPPLEDETAEAICAIRTSQAAKLAVPLSESVEPRAVMSARDRFWAWTTACDEIGGRVAGAWAGAAPVLADLDVHGGEAEWLGRLETLWPELELGSDGALLTVWEQDPWARGAYSVLPLVPDLHGTAASTSPGPNIVFAGEHTAEPEWTGTMEGALRSGLRAAAELEA